MSVEIVFKGKPDDETAALFVRMLGKLVAIENRLTLLEGAVMGEKEVVADLAVKVGEMGTVVESAMALIDGLIAAINGASDVSPEVSAILATVQAQRDALAAKVVEGTAAAQPGGVQPV